MHFGSGTNETTTAPERICSSTSRLPSSEPRREEVNRLGSLFEAGDAAGNLNLFWDLP